MSHSSGIGKDVHETTNGTDTSDCPGTCNGTSIPTTQVEKCREAVALLEQDEQRETVETLMHPSNIVNPVCKNTQKYTNSAPHTHTHACYEGCTHTYELEHTPYSQSISKESFYLDTSTLAPTQASVVCGGGDEKEAKTQNEESDDLKTNDDGQQTALSYVQESTSHLMKPCPAEESTISHTPPTEQSNPNLASHTDDHSSASTPTDQTPPLVPAPRSSLGPPAVLPEPDDWPRPVHVMAEVRVRSAPGQERIVRGMQDSKSLDGISEVCGSGTRAAAGRGGQVEGRRATISSALELEGTVSHDGDITNFITKNLEQKIKMSSRPSLDTDTDPEDCAGPVVRGHGLLCWPADIPPIDPSVLLDLHKHTQEVAHSVEMMLRSLNGTIQNMTALSVGYIQTYRDSVDSLGESVDMSIKGMYTLMARCEELDRSMQPIQTLAAQIRDIKRKLDTLETLCK